MFEQIGDIFAFKKCSFCSFGGELEWSLGEHSLIPPSENQTVHIITVVGFVLHLFSLYAAGRKPHLYSETPLISGLFECQQPDGHSIIYRNLQDVIGKEQL